MADTDYDPDLTPEQNIARGLFAVAREVAALRTTIAALDARIDGVDARLDSLDGSVWSVSYELERLADLKA
jgi:hypothetical protein